MALKHYASLSFNEIILESNSDLKTKNFLWGRNVYACQVVILTYLNFLHRKHVLNSDYVHLILKKIWVGTPFLISGRKATGSGISQFQVAYRGLSVTSSLCEHDMQSSTLEQIKLPKFHAH